MPDYSALEIVLRKCERLLNAEHGHGWRDRPEPGWVLFPNDLAVTELHDLIADLRSTAAPFLSHSPVGVRRAIRALLDALPIVPLPNRNPGLVSFDVQCPVPPTVLDLVQSVQRALPSNPSSDAARWKPQPGNVSVTEIMTDPRFRKNGISPARSLIQQWEERDDPGREQHPATQEVYLPEKWVHVRIGQWNPRTRNKA